MQAVGVDDDPVSVNGDGHHSEGGHIDGDAGEGLDHAAKIEALRQDPGDVEAINDRQGNGASDQ